MKRNYLRFTGTALVTALSVSLLAGCGSSASTVASAETAAALYSRSQSSDDTDTMMKGEVTPEEAMDIITYHSGEILTSENTLQPVETNRKLIRNANMTVETNNFDTLLSGINQTTTELGGYIEQADISGNSISANYSGRRYAYYSIRIPNEKMDQFIIQVSEQGNVTNKSEFTQDVTLQYSDLESRKKSLSIEQERIWALLEKADTLEAVIALETRLSEIRYQLESFESQLRLFDNQVDYSTISLNIHEVQVFTPTTPDSIAMRIQKGFSRNLTNVSNGLVNFFVWLISSLPVLLLLAVIITIIILIIRVLTKQSKPKQPKPIQRNNNPLPPNVLKGLPTPPKAQDKKADNDQKND